MNLAAWLHQRYARVCAPWLRPVAAVLRRAPDPIRPSVAVHVNAFMKLMVRLAARENRHASRPESFGSGVHALKHITTRYKRIEMSAPGRPRAIAVSGGSLSASPLAAPPPIARPVPMVLARPSAPAQLSAAHAAAAIGESKIDARQPRVNVVTREGGPIDPTSRFDVNRLTDRVVAAIDRRLAASRERMRG